MNQNQLNAEADVVQTTTTTSIFEQNDKNIGSGKSETTVQHMTSNVYISNAIPKVIKFLSRASVKIVDKAKQEHYYTIEYGEERQIDDFNMVDIDKERQLLIDDCNNIVDNQIKEIVETFLR